jgi:hypothetical protein
LSSGPSLLIDCGICAAGLARFSLAGAASRLTYVGHSSPGVLLRHGFRAGRPARARLHGIRGLRGDPVSGRPGRGDQPAQGPMPERAGHGRRGPRASPLGSFLGLSRRIRRGGCVRRFRPERRQVPTNPKARRDSTGRTLARSGGEVKRPQASSLDELVAAAGDFHAGTDHGVWLSLLLATGGVVGKSFRTVDGGGEGRHAGQLRGPRARAGGSLGSEPPQFRGVLQTSL